VLSPLLVLPFFAGGGLITFSFRRHAAGGLYFFDLIGATCGLVAGVALIPQLKAESALIVGAALVSVAGLFGFPERRHGRAFRLAFGGVAALCLVFLVLSSTRRTFDLEIITHCYDDTFPRKTFCNWHQPDTRRQHVVSYDNLVARISVWRRTFADGQTALYVDYDGLTNDRITEAPQEAWRTDVRIPFGYEVDGRHQRLFEPSPAILLVGAAAQGVVKTLKNLVTDPAAIHALELNPAVVKIMREDFYQFSARAYEGLTVDVIDVRTFLAQTDARYRIITLLNTYRTENIATLGEADFLHTTDALRAYFDHLEPGGFLLLEERDVTERARFAVLRVMHNLHQVLTELGAQRPADHFFVYTFNTDKRARMANRYAMLAVKKTPLTEADIAFFDGFLALRHDLETRLGRSSLHTQLQHLPGRQTDSEYSAFLHAANKAGFGGPRVDLSPNSDDNPYVFAVYDDEPLLSKLLRDVGAICALLILAALAGLDRTIRRRQLGRAGGLALFFALIGLGYLIIEVALMKLYQSFMGSPTYALVFVLGGLLLSSGLGSILAGRRPGKTLWWAYGGVVALAVAHLLLRDALMTALGSGPLQNSLIVALTVMPLGFCMGIPFPMGVERVKELIGARQTAWYLALNSAAATFAVVLTLYLSVHLGLTITFGLGIACYALALPVLLAIRPAEQ